MTRKNRRLFFRELLISISPWITVKVSFKYYFQNQDIKSEEKYFVAEIIKRSSSKQPGILLKIVMKLTPRKIKFSIFKMVTLYFWSSTNIIHYYIYSRIRYLDVNSPRDCARHNVLQGKISMSTKQLVEILTSEAEVLQNFQFIAQTNKIFLIITSVWKQ